MLALFTGGFIANAMDLSGDNANLYNAMINSMAMVNDAINNKLMFGAAFMSAVIIIDLLFLILNITICFLKDEFFIKTKK